MRLLGVEQIQLFSETTRDACAVVGWGRDTVVVAFRGTVTATNWLADLRVCLQVCVHVCVRARARACVCDAWPAEVETACDKFQAFQCFILLHSLGPGPPTCFPTQILGCRCMKGCPLMYGCEQ
jgi:hypothetical protein